MLPTILLSQPSVVNAGRRERGSIRMPAVFAFEGCTDATMINYNMHATIDNGSCFPATVGCLDRNAQNFNCTLPGECCSLGVAYRAILGTSRLSHRSSPIPPVCLFLLARINSEL